MYNPYLYQQPQITQPQQANNGILWVQGVEGAKSYLVAPNNSVILMDSEGNKFYIKSADMAGMPTLREFTYTENTKPQNGHLDVKAEDLPTKAEIEALKGQIQALQTNLDALTGKVSSELTAREKLAKAKKVVADDE